MLFVLLCDKGVWGWVPLLFSLDGRLVMGGSTKLEVFALFCWTPKGIEWMYLSGFAKNPKVFPGKKQAEINNAKSKNFKYFIVLIA